MQLEDLRSHSTVGGVHPDGTVSVVSVQWFGSEAVEPTCKRPDGQVANELLYRDDEACRLVSEAQRIRLAHLFDPHLAVHTSVVEPLPRSSGDVTA